MIVQSAMRKRLCGKAQTVQSIFSLTGKPIITRQLLAGNQRRRGMVKFHLKAHVPRRGSVFVSVATRGIFHNVLRFPRRGTVSSMVSRRRVHYRGVGPFLFSHFGKQIIHATG